jgi:hypothetical protein
VPPLHVIRDTIRYTRHTTRVDPAEPGTWRDRSAAVFGNRCLVDVVLAIRQLAPAAEIFVTTRLVASETGLGDSHVRPVMLRLESAGLVTRLPRSGGPRGMLYYQVRHGPLWEALVTVCATVREEGSAGSRVVAG